MASQSVVPNRLLGNHVAIAASSSGQTKLVTSPNSGVRIVAYCYNMIANGGVNVKFQSGTGSPTDLTGLYYLTSNTGLVANENRYGWFQTIPGEDLYINLSGSVGVGGVLGYFLVNVNPVI